MTVIGRCVLRATPPTQQRRSRRIPSRSACPIAPFSVAYRHPLSFARRYIPFFVLCRSIVGCCRSVSFWVEAYFVLCRSIVGVFRPLSFVRRRVPFFVVRSRAVAVPCHFARGLLPFLVILGGGASRSREILPRKGRQACWCCRRAVAWQIRSVPAAPVLGMTGSGLGVGSPCFGFATLATLSLLAVTNSPLDCSSVSFRAEAQAGVEKSCPVRGSKRVGIVVALLRGRSVRLRLRLRSG